MSNSNFRDNFSYFAAFIAVLFGLSIFRNDISDFYIQLFFGSFSIFQLAIVFLALMILAMYFGALAILSKSFNFQLFPLTKILENISNVLAAFGLLYPLLIGLTWVISVVASFIPSTFTQNVFVLSTISTLAGLAVGVALRYASDRFVARYEAKLSELRKNVITEKTPINVTETSPYEIVMLYHQLVSLERSILNLKGYGSSGENVMKVTKNLISLSILDEGDLVKIKNVQSIRNRIAHPDRPVSSQQIKKARHELESLINKLKMSIVAIDTNIK